MPVDFQAIPGNYNLATLYNASVASNGVCVATEHYMVAPAAIELVSAWWTPLGSNQNTEAGAASYRNIYVVNGGTAGTATTRMASLALNASKASLAPLVLSLIAGSVSAAVGEVIKFSSGTTGGDHNDSTVLRAGFAQIAYRLV